MRSLINTVSHRPSINDLRAKAFKNPDVRKEYDELGPSFEMRRRMIALRKAAGLTQEQMAELLGTQKGNVSRLESFNSDISPRFATIEKYARVLGYSIRVEFEPRP